MKTLLSPRGLFALGFVILVATNIVVLSGVASNRAGAPEALITLTERELQLPYRVYEENSGLALRIKWRVLTKKEDGSKFVGWRSPAWLNAEKLKELGFTTDTSASSEDIKDHHKLSIPKEVFIVLENNGDAYREAVKVAEEALEREEGLFKLKRSDKKLRDSFKRAEKQLERERLAESRLFAIDAGLDARQLREKYGDRTRFIISKGLVTSRYGYDNRKEVFGDIMQLSISSISVPLKYRKMFESILGRDKSTQDKFGPPRYEVELAYGSRLEPWIVSVHLLDNKSD